MKDTQLDTKEEIEVLDMVPAFRKFVILGNQCFLPKTLQRGSNNQPETNEAVHGVESLAPDCSV